MKKNVIYVLAFILLGFTQVKAQIGPPGMGNVKSALWTAFGVKWDLDSINRFQSTSYVAIGQKSNVSDYNPVAHLGVFVISEEISQALGKGHSLGYGLSYRQAFDYSDVSPYDEINAEQEFRFNLKYGYSWKINARWTVKGSAKEEFRKFYNRDFSKAAENFALRSRLNGTVVYKLSPKNNQSLSLGFEGLWSTNQLNNENHDWTGLKYKALHILFYYSWDLPNTPLRMDIGYMNNLMHNPAAPKWGAQYLAADLVWHIPYKKHHS